MKRGSRRILLTRYKRDFMGETTTFLLSLFFAQISQLPGKGKCLIARRDILAGEVILTEKPLIHMPDTVYK